LAVSAVSALTALLVLSGCASNGSADVSGSEAGDRVRGALVDPDQVPAAPNQRPVTRAGRLAEDIQQILKLTLPEVKSLVGDLDRAVAGIKPPESLATNQPGLSAWRQDRRQQYRKTVTTAYAETARRLQNMLDFAMDSAEARARALAPPRSPLDPGPTGDATLDQALSTFAEVLDGALGLADLEVRQSQDAARVVELFEVFSTFGAKQPGGGPAEDAMQGRIMLFVGGDETASAPRAVLVFRDDAGKSPRALVAAQVTRHRVMRGANVEADFGWRPSAGSQTPGVPPTEAMGAFVIAPSVEPVMDTTSPYFTQLRDMRIVVDTQSGFFDEAGTLVGGVDWRIEYSVSSRGDLTWILAGGKPAYDPYCAEIRATLGR
jgi:hypothetical protein